jgi:hypothetical protein
MDNLVISDVGHCPAHDIPRLGLSGYKPINPGLALVSKVCRPLDFGLNVLWACSRRLCNRLVLGAEGSRGGTIAFYRLVGGVGRCSQRLVLAAGRRDGVVAFKNLKAGDRRLRKSGLVRTSRWELTVGGGRSVRRSRAERSAAGALESQWQLAQPQTNPTGSSRTTHWAHGPWSRRHESHSAS